MDDVVVEFTEQNVRRALDLQVKRQVPISARLAVSCSRAE